LNRLPHGAGGAAGVAADPAAPPYIRMGNHPTRGFAAALLTTSGISADRASAAGVLGAAGLPLSD